MKYNNNGFDAETTLSTKIDLSDVSVRLFLTSQGPFSAMSNFAWGKSQLDIGN